jgi:hypothetical protein
MVYKRVLLVFFSILNIVFIKPFYFNVLICYNEPFYISTSLNFSILVNLFTLVVKCGVSRFCVGLFFYYVFFTLYSMNLYVSVPLVASLSFGLLGSCVGFLFYFNLVFSEHLCFNIYFLL